jgi:uncharacterized membrane protein YdjX (TVP38/TMEM64 family)
MRKVLLVLLAVGVVALFFGAGFDRYLTLESLKESQGQFAAMRAQSPRLTALAAFLIYVGIVALSLPGATVMSLAIGALFGFWGGALLVSFASTIGATLAFLASRYLLRDMVQQRFGDRLKGVNAGMVQEGAFYLFMLRLVPVFPFFLINLLMGLTPVRTVTFYWVSQIGMLPGTLVYVNAGTQLGRVDSLSGILTPGVLLSFALMGAFPLVAKRVGQALRRRRA